MALRIAGEGFEPCSNILTGRLDVSPFPIATSRRSGSWCRMERWWRSGREGGLMSKAGKNDDGERIPSRADDFLALPRSVNVPREKKGVSWAGIKSATWLRRAASRK